MAWIYLIIAGLFEIGWALTMKQSEGFTKLGPSLWTLGLMLVSFGLLSQAVKTLPIGTSYAVWTGIGAVGTAISSMILHKEPWDLAKLFFMALIVVGIIGLKRQISS